MIQEKSSRPIFSILFAVSMVHLLNDMIQGVIPATYPLLKEEHHLSFSQVGMITMVYQIAASIFQPVVGSFTDKHMNGSYVLSFSWGLDPQFFIPNRLA